MRDHYQHQLDQIIAALVDMAGDVRAALADATSALLDGDASAAEAVISADKGIDDLRERIEEESFAVLALQSPVASDLRTMVATLRMVSDLERIGDLAVHIAKVARMRFPARAVPGELVPTIRSMASTADEMLALAAETVATRDVEAARSLERADDAMDSGRRSTFAVLLSDEWHGGVETAIDMALRGRYYERIGDHAVSLGRRVVYLVTGSRVVPV